MSTTPASHGHEGPLRALKHYNFRLFWCGQILSLIGSWMQGIAQSWLILILADPVSASTVLKHGGDVTTAAHNVSPAIQALSNRYQGEVNFYQGIPVLILTIFAGVVIDRVNKRRLLVVTQVGYMLCALVIGLSIRAQLVTINEVMIVALMVGALMAFDMPARQSFVVELVGRKDVPSAVALNSSLFNAARAIGPGVAGILLQHFSLYTCFILNAASYLLVIAGILLMRGKTIGDPVPQPVDEPRPALWENLKGGFDFVRHNHTTRNVVMLVGVLGMFGLAYNVLVPTFVRYDLLPDASSARQVQVFGFLESVRGLGALVAALLIAVLSRPSRYKWNIIVGGLLSNAVVMIYATERHIEVAYITMAVSTFGFVLIFASANTVMQLTVPDHLRGRVMAIYTLVFIGSGPLGSLLAGHLAERIGAPHTIFLFALLTFIAVLWISFRPGGLYTISVTGDERLHTEPHAMHGAIAEVNGSKAEIIAGGAVLQGEAKNPL